MTHFIYTPDDWVNQSLRKSLASDTWVQVYRRVMNENLKVQDDWVPASCTLPTVEQPLRRAEFDALFAEGVLAVEQTSSGEIAIALKPESEVAARAAQLATAETSCCSFFTFAFTITDGRVDMVVSTDPQHEDVLAALASRAAYLVGTTA
jgi:hypothetical protein